MSETPEHFLSRAEVAEVIEVKPATLARYKLPPEDATIGKVRGWRLATIIAWDAARPGQGKRP